MLTNQSQKNKMKKIVTVFLVIVFLLIPSFGKACSMYKITKNGKTIVGNNEDYDQLLKK